MATQSNDRSAGDRSTIDRTTNVITTNDNQTNELNYKLGGELVINRLGYGAMQLTGRGVFGEVADRANAVQVLKEAVKSGVNFIDTAEAYGPQLNETLIADALMPYPGGVVIATKGGFSRPGPDQWVPNGDPEFIRQNILGSLDRLKVQTIDLWQLHRIDPNFPVEETLAPVAEAVSAGKIRFVGLSEVGIADIERVRKFLPIVSVQNLYNLGNRKWEDVLQYTIDNDLAFIPWYPLASGPDKIAGKIESIARQHKATTSQIALAWLLKRSSNMLLIPGTKSIAHLQENMQAADVQLTDEEFQQLSAW